MKNAVASFHFNGYGSHENKSARARRAFVLNVFTDGTQSNTDEVLLKGVPVIKKGNKMQGRFFPLIFNPETAY